MWARLAAILLIASALAMSFQGRTDAQTMLEKLVMPGPLAEKHAKLETDCGKCHEAFSRKAQSGLCLDCHKEIAADRAGHKALHGSQKAALTQDCRQCHTDHKGRGADITQLDKETFNHDLANFRLVDAHKSVRCEDCHVSKVKFHGTPMTCFECHKKVDPHHGRLGEQCESCHGAAKWREIRPYDHAKTRFPLLDAHKAVACATCHVGQQYKDLSSSCASCHKLQDVHAARYGEKCEACHDQAKWKPAHFNHDKTKYPLRNAHIKVKCDACHTGDLYHDKLATTCISCHRKQDPHQGKLGERCEKCHNDRDWRRDLSFDHEMTRFPLIGLHASVPCEECHRSQAYKNTATACQGCHKDVHQGRLGLRCETCHNPNGWALWRYDHAKQTRFPLVGAHQKVACESCHRAKSPPNLKLAMDCVSCHRATDVHNGSFGQNCERCHVPDGWRKVDIRN